ncbi:MAG: hypothetical protein U1F68_14940 [Gammaproteobacteria bacterium]
MSELVELCRLYRTRARSSGREVLTGRLNPDVGVMLLKNREQQQKADGDYKLVVWARDPAKAALAEDLVKAIRACCSA